MLADPSWREVAAWIGAGGGAALVAMWQGRKAPVSPSTQMAGALVDARSIRVMTEALMDASEQHHRDTRKLAEAVVDCAEAVRAQTDASINMVKFMRRTGGEHGG